MKRKLAFVVQRYGLEVNGGAELLVRQMAERLTDQYEVEVITTKAQDYITWKDEYQKDIDEINGVTVRRFGVTKPRDVRRFGHICLLTEHKIRLKSVEERWIEEQGPRCPALVDYIESHADDYDVFCFMTYLYYTTVRGLPKVAEKSILIPTAHDEPTIYMKVYREVFHSPKGLFYCTPTEKRFVDHMFHTEHKLNNQGLGGAGVDLPEQIDREAFRKKNNIGRYMVYAGRIDTHKGCTQLFEFFSRYKEETKSDLKLVMMGKVVMEIPERDDIISLGFVSDQEKFEVMAAAEFLIMPSQFESLSMVVLESLALGVPVVVNGLCEVLKAHCTTGDVGLYYTNYEEFRNSVTVMLEKPSDRKRMGENGLAYIDQYYRWDVILGNFTDMVEKICGERRVL